ncbi:hypothetical protein C5167_048314 [Papaver somniferum]|uniref:Phytocyanin domain-containing protein n=1 Tax=Papaver somniferum TaxID=3469 RepID=A0A4Y7KHK7_PAPSO|nr:uclacyanin-2-like [Papaver somniferum]RZC72834.1 hypothetical protein C5167_048314 [Papaver somniferum]
MATPSAATISLMVLLLVAPAVFAANYPISWTQGTNYDNWDSDKDLVAGDTITFEYGPSHTVNVVDKDAYDNCGSAAISKHSGGSSKITLEAGTMYFICPEGNHCADGMKLSVQVGDADTPSPPDTPTTPTTPATPATPATPPTPTSPATPTDPSTPTTPSKPSPPAGGTGAATSSVNMNFIVIGGSILLASLFAFLG